jgi:hypothetical protein
MKLILIAALAAVYLCGQETDYVRQVTNKPAADAGSYDWTRTNGVGASGTLTSSGSKTINITRCPKGLSSTQYYVRISGGSGTAEVAPVTAFSCSAGAASGTITVTTANTHSGSWVIGSASGGLQEAIVAGNLKVLLPEALTIYAPVYVPWSGTTTTAYNIIGRGRYNSIITVATTFPLTASGVFVAAGAEPGPSFSGFTIKFTQPDSTSIAGYTHWPPAFEMSNTPRFVIRDISVIAAWDGIKALQNAGGTVIQDVWMSAFSKGIQYDGALDSTRIVGFHFWPFGLTANQSTLFLSDTTSVLGMEIGRADDFKLDRALFISQKAVRAWAGSSGFGGGMQISNTSFDTSSEVRIEKGDIFINNSYFSQGSAASTDALVITGGVVNVNNCLFHSDSSTQRAIYAPLAASSTVSITNTRFYGSTVSASAPSVIEVTAAAATTTPINISNNQFTRPAVLFTAPIVNVTNTPGTVRLAFQGNSISDQIGATFLKVSVDDYHRISGNSFVGSISDYPASKVAGVYQDDTSFTMGSAGSFTATTAAVATLTTFTEMGFPQVLFSALPAQASGRQVYCTNCGTSAGACASGGTGAMAFRINGAWRCIQ